MIEKLRPAGSGVIIDDPDPRDLDLNMADFLPHFSRAEKLFKRIQPGNLEYEIIRAKVANREARALLGLD